VSVLLGKRPKECEKLLGRATDWNDLKIARLLRSRGYTVLPITINGICGTKVSSGEKVKMCGMHVILCSQHAYLDEATYSVFHDGLSYHSGDISPITPMEFINYPVWTCFLVWHPKWAPRNEFETKVCRSHGSWEAIWSEKLRSAHQTFPKVMKLFEEQRKINEQKYGVKDLYI
jgi:hypothetical protein